MSVKGDQVIIPALCMAGTSEWCCPSTARMDQGKEEDCWTKEGIRAAGGRGGGGRREGRTMMIMDPFEELI